MDKYTPNQKMFYYRKKKEKKNSKPTNSFELYICTQQAIVCGWMMIFDALDISSNMVICLSPCINTVACCLAVFAQTRPYPMYRLESLSPVAYITGAVKIHPRIAEIPSEIPREIEM